MLVYACAEGIDKQSAMIIFNDVLTVFNYNDEEKDITIVVNKVRSHHRADYDAEKTADIPLDPQRIELAEKFAEIAGDPAICE